MNSGHFISRTAVPRLLAATSRGIATTSLVVLATTANLSAAEAPPQGSDAQSQDKESQAATGGAKDSSLELDTIVVTALPMATSKLKSSISVSLVQTTSSPRILPSSRAIARARCSTPIELWTTVLSAAARPSPSTRSINSRGE